MLFFSTVVKKKILSSRRYDSAFNHKDHSSNQLTRLKKLFKSQKVGNIFSKFLPATCIDKCYIKAIKNMYKGR